MIGFFLFVFFYHILLVKDEGSARLLSSVLVCSLITCLFAGTNRSHTQNTLGSVIHDPKAIRHPYQVKEQHAIQSLISFKNLRLVILLDMSCTWCLPSRTRDFSPGTPASPHFIDPLVLRDIKINKMQNLFINRCKNTVVLVQKCMTIFTPLILHLISKHIQFKRAGWLWPFIYFINLLQMRCYVYK